MLDTDIPNISNDLVIYINLPACLFRCKMCPFYVEIVKSREDISWYADDIIKEFMIYIKSGILAKYNLKAIYFGGGTATLFKPNDIKKIIQTIERETGTNLQDIEITVEGHPVTVDEDYLKAIKEYGVNRVSFGIQSLDDKELKTMKFIQTSKDNYRAINNSIKAGFRTISADMLYRLPNQTIKQVEKQLNQFIETGINSISTYSLELSVRQGELQKLQADDESDKAMFYLINSILTDKNWNHTAQPDYSKKDNISKETVVTWRAPQGHTLGLGAGACSTFNGNTYINVNSLKEYHKVIEKSGLPVLLGQKLSLGDAMSRYMVLGIRCFDIENKYFENCFGISIFDAFYEEIKILENYGLIEKHSEGITVTTKGKYYVDNISKMFYSLENRCRQQPWGELMSGMVADEYSYFNKM